MSLINNLQTYIQQWWARFRCPTEFVCDCCRYDHPSTCRHAVRPNAVKCPDFRRKGA